MPLPEQLSRPGNRLAHLGRGERLRNRRLLVGKLALVCELCCASHHALARNGVAQHFGKKVLNELERADRLSELQSLLCVLERVLVGAHLDSRRLPCNEVPRPAQHARGVAEGLSAGREPICLRHPAVLHGDLTVLDHLERDLVQHLLDAEAGRGLVFDDEALDLVVGQVACPDDRDITPRCVADPPFLAIEDPSVAFALRRRGEAAAGSRADQRLGEAEAADLFHARHVAGASNGWRRRRRDVADLIAEPWSLPPYDVYIGSLIEVAFKIRGYTSVHLPHALLATGRYLSILSTSTLRLNGKRLGLKPLLVEAALLRITRKIGRLVLYRFGFIEWA